MHFGKYNYTGVYTVIDFYDDSFPQLFWPSLSLFTTMNPSHYSPADPDL